MKKIFVITATILVCFFISIHPAGYMCDEPDEDICDEVIQSSDKHSCFMPMRITNNDTREIEITRKYYSKSNITTEIIFKKVPCAESIVEVFEILAHMDDVALGELSEFWDKISHKSDSKEHKSSNIDNTGKCTANKQKQRWNFVQMCSNAKNRFLEVIWSFN